jgi:hypothetical protein
MYIERFGHAGIGVRDLAVTEFFYAKLDLARAEVSR